MFNCFWFRAMYQPRHDLIRTLDHVVLFCAQESVRKMTISGRLCLSVQEFSSLFPPLCVKSHKELRATSVPAKHINCQSPQPWKGKLLTAISLNLICMNLFDLQRDWLIPIPLCRIVGQFSAGQFGTGQFGTGQFGTRQFGTKIIKRTIWHQDNKSAQFGTKIIKMDNLAPGQIGTGQFGPRTIRHQTFEMIKLNLKKHFWQHFGQKFSFGVIVCPFGHKYG